MNLKHILNTLIAISTLLLVGCGPSITNLTSERLPQNASAIYTLSMSVTNDNGSVIDESLSPVVVIDGQKQPMRRSEIGTRIFDYDYLMPEGRAEAKFYFLLDYEVNYMGSPSPRQISSQLQKLTITNQYVITMESQRGPVGAEIPVVGRGFTEQDVFVIGGVEADTIFSSPQSLTFIVPPIPSGEAYSVDLLQGDGVIPIGYFQVDGSRLKVFPDSLQLSPGQKVVLIFGTQFPAPEGGVPLTVVTNVPGSIIMPEVIIPEGSSTVSVQVQGGQAGQGKMVVSAPGFTDLTIPVMVQGDVLQAAQTGAFVAEETVVEESFSSGPVGEDILVIEEAQVIEVTE